MNNGKAKWSEAILNYLMTRATPVDGMVWVKPRKVLRTYPIDGLIPSEKLQRIRRASDGIPNASG